MQSNSKIHRKPRKNRKFRWGLLSKWLTTSFYPTSVADVGGGKGMLSYMLIKAGWQSTVIDPVDQPLLEKFTDLEGKRIRIQDLEKVPRINKPFAPELVKNMQLIVGMHAHGCNMEIMNLCKETNKDFVLIPCCVIDEPIEKRHGVNWQLSLIEYATKLGINPKTFKLNFKGKNIVIYTDRFLKRRYPDKSDSELATDILKGTVIENTNEKLTSEK